MLCRVIFWNSKSFKIFLSLWWYVSLLLKNLEASREFLFSGDFMFTRNSFKAISFCIFSLIFISCGSDRPMVNDVKVETIVQDSDLILSLSADLSIGNLQLPNATIPIILPKDGREIGVVSLVSTLDGKNILGIDLNVSESSNLELASARLPNGSIIPLIGDTPVLAIPVKNVVVYLSLVSGAEAIGVAVPIRSFDALGSKVGTTALMPIFSKNGNVGAAGLFTSKNAGENGIAIVADISAQMNGLDHLINSNNMPQMQQDDSAVAMPLGPSRSQKRSIDRELYKMHKKRKKLVL